MPLAKIAQKLPRDINIKVGNFQKCLIQLWNSHNYDLSKIRNMNEMPIMFDLPSNRTVNAIWRKRSSSRRPAMRRPILWPSLPALLSTWNWSQWPSSNANLCLRGKVFERPDHQDLREWVDGWEWLQTVAVTDLGQVAWCNAEEACIVGVEYFMLTLLTAWRGQPSTKIDLCKITEGLASVLQPLEDYLNKPFKVRLLVLLNDYRFDGYRFYNRLPVSKFKKR